VTLILIVDDEPQIRRALRVNLEARSYATIEAEDGRSALRSAADANPDMVLLDLGLPDIDGVDIVAGIRGWSQVPIIVLTARDDEHSKVLALDAGADDYVTKPFGINELLARIRASLRRVGPTEESPAIITADAFVIDLAAKTAVRTVGSSAAPTDVHLTPTEWSIVEYLVRHPDRLVTQRQIVDAVWGPAYAIDANLIRVHLTHIRAKLEPEPAHPKYFVTEPGMGYRFVNSSSTSAT
jgi:two-component system, OmpR family, KDP operon response regulator KdpE